MFNKLNLIYVFAFVVFSIGCEIPANRKNIRSPHLPVFADLNEGKSSTSNPYWFRITAINNEPQINLNDGYVFKPDRPTLYGTIGTHYKFKNNYYAYAMTDGIGFQKDLNYWSNGKWGVGAFIGIRNSWGLQIMASQNIGQIYNGEVLIYTSIQRRSGYHKVACELEENIPCREEAPTSENSMTSEHETLDVIIGTELGRFKMGDKGNTTVNIKLELGYNKILSRKVTAQTYTSNFKVSDDNLTLGLHYGINLW